MAEWWEVPDVNFDLFGDSGSAWWDTGSGGTPFDFSNFNFDFQIPEYDFTFDPGQFDLGFDPSFNFDQFNFDQFQDPFSLPAGDLSLPNLSLGGDQPFDFGQAYAQNGQFNLGDFNPSLMSELTPTSFGEVPALNFDQSALTPNFDQIFGSNVGGFDQPFSPSLSTGLAPGEGLGAPAPTPGGSAASGTSNLNQTRDNYYKWAPLLGLGELGLKLGGGLMGAFGPQPTRKLSGPEAARMAAETDAIRAKIELDKQALAQQLEIARLQRSGGGGSGGGGGVENHQLEVARIQAETALKVAEMNKRHPLFQTDPRFSTLFDETSAAQQALSPDSPEIQTMTQQIYAVRNEAAAVQFQQQRDGILERANRLGTNPAAELAQINDAEQKAKQALFVEAQQQALAFAASRLDPSNELLQAIMGTVV